MPAALYALLRVRIALLSTSISLSAFAGRSLWGSCCMCLRIIDMSCSLCSDSLASVMCVIIVSSQLLPQVHRATRGDLDMQHVKVPLLCKLRDKMKRFITLCL